MRGGVRQLLRFELKEQLKQLEKNLSGQGRYLSPALLQLHTLIGLEASFAKICLNTIADRAFIGDDALPRSEKEFITQRQRARARLPAVTEANAAFGSYKTSQMNLPAIDKQGIGDRQGTSGTGAPKRTGAGSDKPKGSLGAQLRKQLEPTWSIRGS